MDNITNTDDLLADLNKLDINDLLDIVEASMKVIDAKTSKYKGLDLLELMELDDKYQVFNRIEDVADLSHEMCADRDRECFALMCDMYKDVICDDLMDTLFDLRTWAEQIDLLEKLRQGK